MIMMLKTDIIMVVFRSFFSVNRLKKIKRQVTPTSIANTPNTIVTSDGTALISPPVAFDDFVRVINFEGMTMVVVAVDTVLVSPLNAHHGDISAIMSKPIAKSFRQVMTCRFHMRNPRVAIRKAMPR